MAWLYVPGLADLSSELHPSYEATAPFVMSRGRPMPQHALLRAWKKGDFIRRLSGLTCEPSAAAHGVAAWMSLLPATPASHFPSLAGALARRTCGTSGRRSRGSS